MTPRPLETRVTWRPLAAFGWGMVAGLVLGFGVVAVCTGVMR